MIEIVSEGNGMELVAVVVLAALIQYIFFGMLVGRARGQYNVEAPAVSGHPVFERYNRVHQNTLECLITFIPAIVAFALYVRADVAAGLGVVFIIGRFIYLRSYVADPKSRGLGFILTFLPTVIMILGGGAGALMSYLQG